MFAKQREERWAQCQQLLAKGWSFNDISKFLRMSSKTVAKVAKGLTPATRSPGRPSTLTSEHIRFIEVNSLANARLTDEELAEMTRSRFGISLSRTTVCRVRQKLGFVYRPPKVVQALTEEQKKVRFDFCNWILQHRDEVPNIIFSDESRFQKGCDNKWRRIRRGQWNESCYSERKKFPPGCMVWGAIGVNYRTPLIKCSSGVTSAEYRQILEKSRLISDLDGKYGRSKWTFMQDGAACHTAKDTEAWLESQHVCVVPGWPANSPDLNPIELIWAIMKVQLRKQKVETEEEFYRTLCGIWEALEETAINSLVESFIGRCDMVRNLNGNTISAYLSSHMSIPPSVPERPRWSPDDDRHLEEMVTQYGPKWSRIASLLDRSIPETKNRWQLIMRAQRNRDHRAYRALPPISELLPDLDDIGLLFSSMRDAEPPTADLSIIGK